MKINPQRCVRCLACIPYCPVEAIIHDKEKNVVYTNGDCCVECGTCLRSQVCPTDAIWQDELTYPRILRANFSAVTHIFESTDITGRGTDEMKTNDVTNRFKEGEVGFGVEVGRPGISSTLDDLELIAVELAKIGVQFEPENPITQMLDMETGKFKDEKLKNEKVLSAIIEFRMPEERALEVIKVLKDVSKRINTVFSLDCISRCKNGKIPVKSILDKAGIKYYPNGKTNCGLGYIKGV